MKNKIYAYSIVILVVSGLLASCSSENKGVASNFYKRKYNTGFFWNRPGKVVSPVANKATRTEPNIAPTAISAAKKSSFIASQPVAASSTGQITADNNQKSSVATKKVNNTIAFSPAVAANNNTSISSSIKNQTSSNSVSSVGQYHNGGGGGGGDCKSWIAALLLCFFLGGLGIHRFYLGYTWQGIVQLLTLGGCGIWALIDFIRIIMRTLPPNDGSYCD